MGLPAGFQGVVFSLSNVVIQSSLNSFNDPVLVAGSAADLVNPVAFGGAVVLADKGDGGLMECVHGGVDKALNVGPGGGAGHQHRSIWS